MSEVSRTARVIQNAKVALFFYCINLILQFFSRKIFLDYLGAELLGLNTTAQNLLQFLNLAESGIGAAVAFALYKPLSQKNKQEIIDIVSLQGWFYRWVGMFVIAGSIVLMAFFPWIFAKADVPLIYAYGTFVAFLISALLGYFVNYKMIVLSADQKEYKITIETQSIKAIKIFIQLLMISTFSHGYLWWMSLETIAAVITAIRLTRCIKKEYPWLSTSTSRGKQVKEQYSFLLTKTKQLFFHKIGAFALGQVTPLLIYGFTTLTTVAVYGNYMLIMAGCSMLVEAVSQGLKAGIGNLVSKGDQSAIKRTFWQIISIRLFIASFLCSGFFLLSESFVTLWVGREYVMPVVPMVLMVASYFIQMSRTCEFFLNAYGLFQDIWAPVVEATLNIFFSFLLGYFFGLSGVFIGVLISQLIVVNGWKAIFLYKWGFNEDLRKFIVPYTKKMILVFSLQIGVCSLCNSIFKDAESFCDWIGQGALFTFFYLSMGIVFFYFFDKDFRGIFFKLKGLLFGKRRE